MPLQQFMRDIALRSIALSVHKRHMMIDIADSLQLVRMSMVMRAPVDADEEDCDVRPRQPQQVQLELIHICRFSIEQQQHTQHRRAGSSLPAIHRMVCCRLGMLLEMKLLDLLPAGHHASAAAEPDVAPHAVEVAMIDCADDMCAVREGDEIIAATVVVMVRKGIGEAANDCFGNVCVTMSASPT